MNKPNKQIQTTWNLGLLYKNHNDPQIEKDMLETERAFDAFEKKYRGKTDYLKSDTKLAQALAASEALSTDRAVGKPFMYFSFALKLNSEDTVARARVAQFTERFARLDQKVLFLGLAIAKIPVTDQKKFLRNPKLAPYRYLLGNIFKHAVHNLSEAEEKIMILKSNPSHDLWTALTDKMLSTLVVQHQGKEIPHAEAMSHIANLETAERRELHNKAMKALETLGTVAESEINAVCTNKKINDDLRGFKEPYDASILGFENDKKSVMTLVDTVTKNFSISHRFFKLKAKLLKLPHLEYADRNAGIGKNVKKVTFPEAVTILQKVFGDTDPMYRKTLEDFLERGQIDVYPRKGKDNGAHCNFAFNIPTFVLLNYTDTVDQVSTFAHEMGHAIHTELSRIQPIRYQGYSISTAEVASTFFEMLTFDALLETLSESEQMIALHNKISDDMQTVFRQIACFNFETELHNSIRAKGALSKEEIRTLLNKHMSAYLGPIFKMTDLDGNFFVTWGHIRKFFYVYTYAFGQLISKALYAKYKEDKKFIKQVNAFLSAGGSDTPENIFKSIGIDVTKPDFWEKGLKSIEKDIERLEKLSKKR